MNIKSKTKPAAVLISTILLILSAVSLLYILLSRKEEAGYIADIYQDGSLLISIPLTEVHEPYTFTVTGASGCQNQVEVRPGSIGIISADCPDKLCVHQGFVSDSRLPVTCLPNRLVIQLRPVSGQTGPDTEPVDMITY